MDLSRVFDDLQNFILSLTPSSEIIANITSNDVEEYINTVDLDPVSNIENETRDHTSSNKPPPYTVNDPNPLFPPPY